MKPRCPSGTTFLTDYSFCAYPCDPGLEEFNLDDSFCVGTLCPNTTEMDLQDNSRCWKSFSTKVVSCPTGTTEWMPNKCYLDCPAGFRENGQSCLIPTLRRRVVPPNCPYLYNFNGETCDPGFFIIFLFVFGLLLLIAAVRRLYRIF